MAEDTMHCPVCDGPAVRDVRPRTIAYRSATVTIEQPAWYCTRCGEGTLVDDDASLADFAFQQLRASVEGLPPTNEAMAVRRRARILDQVQHLKRFG